MNCAEKQPREKCRDKRPILLINRYLATCQLTSITVNQAGLSKTTGYHMKLPAEEPYNRRTINKYNLSVNKLQATLYQVHYSMIRFHTLMPNEVSYLLDAFHSHPRRLQDSDRTAARPRWLAQRRTALTPRRIAARTTSSRAPTEVQNYITTLPTLRHQ